MYTSALAQLVYAFLLLPIVAAIFVMAAFLLLKERAPAVLAAVLVFCAVTWILFRNTTAIRDTVRWRTDGSSYRHRVLAQPDQAGSLKHVVWDEWKFPTTGETTVYLVHDPTNSLATATSTRAAGKLPGIPCSVTVVRRLASGWYTVEFHPRQTWSSCKSGAGKTDSRKGPGGKRNALIP